MTRRLLSFMLATLAVLAAAPAGALAAAPAKTDVLLLFDTTGSMSGALSSAQESAQTIVGQVRARLGDVSFGVAAVGDYPIADFSNEDSGDRPYRVVTPVTADAGTIATGIDTLVADGGGDGPEAYGRALRDADVGTGLGWRPGARRLVVLIADNVPHDDDLNAGIPTALQSFPSPFDTLSDPGDDSVVGTGDDIDWQPLLTRLAHDGLPLMYVLFEGDEAYLPYWRVWAGQTGGTAEDADAADLTETVVTLAEQGATGNLPPCALGESRDASGVCAPIPAPQPQPQPQPQPVPAPPTMAQLAFTYRPALLFDSGEPWRPLNVDRFLAEGGHELCINRRFRGDDCDGFTGTTQMASDKFDGDDAYLSIHKVDGKLQTPATCRGSLLDCDAGANSAIYWHAVMQGDQLYLDYWYFLRNNDYTGDVHEGDWEGAVVHLARSGTGWSLVDVLYPEHKSVYRYLNLNVLTAPGTAHPVVYLAKGTHATYPRACAPKSFRVDCHQATWSWGGIPEASFDGGAAWGNNPDTACASAGCLQVLPVTSWNTWSGRWGKSALASLNSPPTAPGKHGRYTAPWEATDTDRTAFMARARAAQTTARPSCDASWMGFGVQATACDPDALRSSYGTAAPATLTIAGGAGRAPGVAQKMGEALRPGQKVSVSGAGGGATTLQLAVDTALGATRVSVGQLALDGAGTATVQVAGPASAPSLRVTDARGKARTVKVKLPAPAKAAVSAQRRGRRVTVTVLAQSRARLTVDLLGSRSRVVAHRTARAPRAGAATVRFADGRKAATARVRVTLGKRVRTTTKVKIAAAP